ncbi:glycerol-3-phosphate 1-O-acyltransferase PlsY [Thiohalomonas denitrificans]|uniref:glycerol-3-phosphate 1-O-acyltransferase PlsY n=1 Tax=Thiohalomonas denitrificans TaxID=415747 RepID=UPI0026EF57DA|nr:glycerol-3-phosphate 1-O-acyltransferase PlsY [Thiohalomonas denitrificans]
MAAVDYALIALAYALGSVSTAIVVCRLAGLPDPRTEGSKNPGATNVLRLGGKKAAAATLAGDFLKGLLPVLIARLFAADPVTLALVAMAAFLGHLYPVFFGFRGGKGVATAFGVLLGLAWPVALAALATWLVMAKVFRISSLSALTAAALAPVYALWLAPQPALVGMLTTMAVLLIWRHRSNIRNLLAGKENHIGNNDG